MQCQYTYELDFDLLISFTEGMVKTIVDHVPATDRRHTYKKVQVGNDQEKTQ